MNYSIVLIIPTIGLLITGIAMELVDIAQDSGEKVIQFAGDTNNAIDCAFDAIPISECSPNLMNTEFSSDIDNYETRLKEMQEELESMQEELNNAQKEEN